MFVELSIE